jgi:AcrR family transcriptional regulator
MASKDATRRSIISTARALFAELGPRKTTLDDIARRMYRTKTFLYHYFRSKDDLLSALIEEEGDEYMEELRAAVSGAADARARLRAYVMARFRIINRVGTFYGALREGYFERYAFIENARRKYDLFEAETVGAVLADGVASGEFVIADTGLVAHAFLIALKGYEIEWAIAPSEGFEQTIDTLLSILFDGIGRKP